MSNAIGEMSKGKNLKVEPSAGGVLHGINGKSLCMEFLGMILGIDLSVLLDDHFVDSDPPVKFDLFLRMHENVPVGMKHLKWGERLYLLGGEIVEDDGSYVGGSNKIFEFVPNINHPEKSIKDCDMPMLKAPKGSLLVAEIGDLICVIHARSPIHDLHFPSPTFEVYDRNAKMWRGLAAPPEVVFGHYVVGDKLFVIGVLGLYCYNFFSNKWTKADEARRSFKCTPILEPKGAICLRGLQFGPDFHVMINVQEGDKGDTVVTYAMVLNKNGLLLCSQELGQIFSGIRIGMVDHFFFDLGWEEGGNKRICAVLTGFGYDVQSQPIVCVSIFNLRKLDKVELADLTDPPVIPSDGFSSYELPTKTILQVTVIRQRVCILSKHMPDPFIGDAFLF